MELPGKFPGLLTEYMKVDDVSLVQRFESVDGCKNPFEKTHIFLEILIRMGSVGLLRNVERKHLEEAENRLTEIVDDLNEFREQGKDKAIALWQPVAERLGRRIAVSHEIFNMVQSEKYGLEVHAGTEVGE